MGFGSDGPLRGERPHGPGGGHCGHRTPRRAHHTIDHPTTAHYSLFFEDVILAQMPSRAEVWLSDRKNLHPQSVKQSDSRLFADGVLVGLVNVVSCLEDWVIQVIMDTVLHVEHGASKQSTEVTDSHWAPGFMDWEVALQLPVTSYQSQIIWVFGSESGADLVSLLARHIPWSS